METKKISNSQGNSGPNKNKAGSIIIIISDFKRYYRTTHTVNM